MKREFTLMLIERGQTPDLVLCRDFAPDAGFDPDVFKQELTDMVHDTLAENKVTSSKTVVVLNVEAEVNARFLEDSAAAKTPTNGLFAQRVEIQQEFPSARAASLHLGLKNNEVALYLNKSKHLPPAERVAKLRGVTLAYREDYHLTLLGDLRD